MMSREVAEMYVCEPGGFGGILAVGLCAGLVVGLVTYEAMPAPTPDAARMRELADKIEGLPHYSGSFGTIDPARPMDDLTGFTMTHHFWPTDRGRAGGIAAWTCEAWKAEDLERFWGRTAHRLAGISPWMDWAWLSSKSSYGETVTIHRASVILALTIGQARDLARPDIDRDALGRITPQMAANVLRAVADGVDIRMAWGNELGRASEAAQRAGLVLE